jgi:subtilisin family serine protease
LFCGISKKSLSCFLIVVLLLSLLPFNSVSAIANTPLVKEEIEDITKIKEILKKQDLGEFNDVYIDKSIDTKVDSLIKVIVEFNTEPVSVQKFKMESKKSISTSFDTQKVENQLVQKEMAFKQNLENNNIFATISTSYKTVFSGVALELKANEVPKLATIDGVRAVYANNLIQVAPILPAVDFTPQMVNSAPFIGTNEYWKLGYEGEGIKIGVLDTGIDYNHPDLKDAYKGGYDFVNNDEDPFEGTEKIPSYHGTHVSGIIAGRGNPNNGGDRGVAPKSDLYVYRVLGPQGGWDEWVIAGIEKAVEDDMDVINLSLGSSFNDSDSPTARAINNAMLGGTLPVVANGNDGNFPGTVNSPATADLAISVGASIPPSNSYRYKALISSNEGKEFTLNWSNATEPVNIEGLFEDKELVYAGFGAPEDYENLEVTNKVVLVKWNTNYRSELVNQWAEQAGAAAVIMFHTEGVNGYVSRWFPVFAHLPMFDMRADDGREVVKILSEQRTLLTSENTEGRKLKPPNKENKKENIPDNSKNNIEHIIEEQQTTTFKLTEEIKEHYPGDDMADFSSNGPVNDTGVIKPDIVAPGVNIVSTIPLFFQHDTIPSPLDYSDAYLPMSGTSMAAPHIAGLSALVMEAKPSYSNFDIKVALMNTGLKLESKDEFNPYTVQDIGAGRVQGWDALNSPVLAIVHEDVYFTKDPLGTKSPERMENLTGSINFGRIEEFETVKRRISLNNKSNTEKTYTITSEMSFWESSSSEEGDIFTSSTGTKTAVPDGVQLSIGTDQAIVPGNGTLDITVNLDIPENATNGIYEGYIYFTPTDINLPDLQIPFVAYKKSDLFQDLKYFEMPARILNLNNENLKSTSFDYALNSDMKVGKIDIISNLPRPKKSIGYIELGANDLIKGEHKVVWSGDYKDLNNETQQLESGWYEIHIKFINKDGVEFTQNKYIVVSNEKTDILLDQPIKDNVINVKDNWISGSLQSMIALITRDVWFTHDEELAKSYLKVNYEVQQGDYIISSGRAGITNEGVDWDKNEVNFVIKDELPAGKSSLKLTAYDGAGNGYTETYSVFYDKDISASDSLEVLLGQDLIVTLTANSVEKLIGGEFTLRYRSDIFDFDHAEPGFGFVDPDEETTIQTAISDPWVDINGHEYRTLKVGASLLNKAGGTIKSKNGNVPILNVIFHTSNNARYLGTQQINIIEAQYIQDETYNKIPLEGLDFYPNLFVFPFDTRGSLKLEAYMELDEKMRDDIDYSRASIEVYNSETGERLDTFSGYRDAQFMAFVEGNGSPNIHISGLDPSRTYDIYIYYKGHFKGFINNYNPLTDIDNGSMTWDYYVDEYGHHVSSKALEFGKLLAGDVDVDNKIDIFDVTLIARFFGTVADDYGLFEHYLAKDADINDDGTIDILDLSFVTQNYGELSIIQD